MWSFKILLQGAQLEEDWRTDALKDFVMVALQEQEEFRPFRNSWEIDVTIEKQQVLLH